MKSKKYLRVTFVDGHIYGELPVKLDINVCHNISFHKREDGLLEIKAPGLRYGTVIIKESVEDLLDQVDSINIIE